MDGDRLRKVLLEVLDEYNREGPGYLQTGPLLSEAARRLGIRSSLEDEQALLTFWHDLFRTGHLAWGYDLSNAEQPFCHITTSGRTVLQHLSRDPANPDGYMYHLNQRGSLNDISESYLREALQTYNANCFKATAVMIGAAAESIVLELRDTLVSKVSSVSRSLPKDIHDWRIKRVIDALKKELDSQKRNMPRELAEGFEAYWPAFTQQIRAVRNEAGHPSSVDPVTPDAVHASLLIFPELVSLTLDLREWIKLSYT